MSDARLKNNYSFSGAEFSHQEADPSSYINHFKSSQAQSQGSVGSNKQGQNSSGALREPLVNEKTQETVASGYFPTLK